MLKITKSGRRKPVQREDAIQEELFLWVKQHAEYFPELERLCFHVPNGGHRMASVALKMQRQGVKPGVLDVLVLTPRLSKFGLHPYMALELKSPGRKPTPEQIKWMNSARAEGAACAWTDNILDAQRMLLGYLRLTRPANFETGINSNPGLAILQEIIR